MKMSVRSMAASAMICAVFVLGGCAAADSNGSVGAVDSTDGPIEVEENLATVDVRVARSLLDPEGSMSDEEIVSAAAENGMTAAVDGDAVVYTMTKSQRDEMLEELRSSAKDAVDGIIADDSNSITAVEVDDAMTEFTVSVDAERFSPLESLLVIGFYLQGALYQQFAGTSADELDVVVEFVDDATGEVLESGSYQEWRKNLEG
ncbi:hypothetical protein [Agromyces bracchium]|uniref:Uncharacterized protein n=1 Tax=Agromyces bracchium TaxID=88376 RepID=A0A6I3MEM0_9MICO|nr:hypothetical protein [Agromyces bracchium]MTH69816.1 hypothetical protein [Agromyces bracchium]